MPGYTDEQHRRFYEKTGRWHYSAPEHIKKPTKERPLSAIEQSAMRVGTQTFGDTGIPGEYPGSALATRDSLNLGIKQEPIKLTDRGAAIKRIGEGIGTKADSIYVDLLPKPTAPPTPSYSMREVTGPDGKPTLVWVNNRTREIRPVGGGFGPATSKADAVKMRPISDVTKKFTDTVESSDEIMSAPNLLDMEKEKYPAGSPVLVAAENRSRAAEDSLSIAANAERMGYADFNEAAADLKNLEDTYAEYEEMEKRLGRDKAVTEFTRINGKHPALVKQMIYNFRRPLNLSR